MASPQPMNVEYPLQRENVRSNAATSMRGTPKKRMKKISQDAATSITGKKRKATKNLRPKKSIKKIAPNMAYVFPNEDGTYGVTFRQEFIDSLHRMHFKSSLERKEMSQAPTITFPTANRPSGKGMNTLEGPVSVGERALVYMQKKNWMSMHTHPMPVTFDTTRWYISIPSSLDIETFTSGPTAKRGDTHFVLDTHGYYVLVVKFVCQDEDALDNYYYTTVVSKFNEIPGVETVPVQEPGNPDLLEYHAFDKTSFPTLEDVRNKINEVLSRATFFQHFKYYSYSETPSFTVEF